MRYLAIVGVGLGISTLVACGGSDDALGPKGNGTVGTGGFPNGGPCAADVDCLGGQICVQAMCVSARAGTGGSVFGSTGGIANSTGGIIGVGGVPVGVGGMATGGLGSGGIAPGTGGGGTDSGAGGASGVDGGGGAGGSDASVGTGGTPPDNRRSSGNRRSAVRRRCGSRRRHDRWCPMWRVEHVRSG
jgi:hypothetical protein